MTETLIDKVEMLEKLKKEPEGSMIAVLYEEKEEKRSAVGFYYGIDLKGIDLRNFQGRIQNILNLPEGYQILNIPRESFLEYRKLESSDR